MKRKLLIPAIGLMLFAACRKSSVDPMPVAATNARNNSGTAIINTNYNYQTAMPATQQAAIIFRLTAEQKHTPGILQWISGYVATSEITIEGFQNVGNALFRQYAESKAVQTVKLFSPADLGVLTLPY